MTQARIKSSDAGGAEEHHLAVRVRPGLTFAGSLSELLRKYRDELDARGLSPETQVFTQYFLSDIAAQRGPLEGSKIWGLTRRGAFSAVQQPPVDGSAVALLSYHVKSPGASLNRVLQNHDPEGWRNGLILKGGNYSLFWAANLPGSGPADCHGQTLKMMEGFSRALESNGMSLCRHTIRTWIYVKDIYANYAQMVEARREYYGRHGLSGRTRSVASTGIEARLRTAETLVSMNALSIAPLDPRQITKMEAPDHLCPADQYGSTFERGLRIDFGDRTHLYVSGTASIDRRGRVLHVSDARKQTLRALANIEALVRPHGAALRDAVCAVVYIRGEEDAGAVRRVLEERMPPGLPSIVVKGPVCRPAWRVEIEATFILPRSSPYPVFL